MKLVTLTHATVKKPVTIWVNKLFYMYTSETNKGVVHIISDAGAICPVLETEEQIKLLIKQASSAKSEKEKK